MTPIAEENLRTGAAFARLVSLDVSLYTPEEVRAFAADCGMQEHEAFLVLLAAALGREEDRPWQRDYLARCVRPLDAAGYRADPYYAAIRFPEIARGRWRMTHQRFAPYQLIPCGHTRLTPEGRELPRLGYFAEPFCYPAVLENGREWMTVTPNEIATMAKEIAQAQGHVAALGLGLGYFAFMCARKPQVTHVTVVERDADAIALFREQLLPQFPEGDKITLVRADAFDYLQAPDPTVDLVFADLWHDVGDGLPLYLRLLPLAARWRADFRYWIEEDMLIFLRGLLLEEGREMDLTDVKRWAGTAEGRETLSAWLRAPVPPPARCGS
ncbi:MAG: hypothetical protein IJ664_05675 [Clostridia bacterium]|nr:hypothetical protein [Clostridia bacterium]